MMKQSFLVLFVLSLTLAAEYNAPSEQQPMPYEYGYGVNNEYTGDVKEHYETQLENGRTVGEYRVLQENGLFRVVRYYVDGQSGFQAAVTEEKGEDIIKNYAFNSFTGTGKPGSPLEDKFNLITKPNVGAYEKFGTAASVNRPQRHEVTRSDSLRVEGRNLHKSAGQLTSTHYNSASNQNVHSQVERDFLQLSQKPTDHLSYGKVPTSKRQSNVQIPTEDGQESPSLSNEVNFEKKNEVYPSPQIVTESSKELNFVIAPLDQHSSLCDTFNLGSNLHGCDSRKLELSPVLPLQEETHELPSQAQNQNNEHTKNVEQHQLFIADSSEEFKLLNGLNQQKDSFKPEIYKIQQYSQEELKHQSDGDGFIPNGNTELKPRPQLSDINKGSNVATAGSIQNVDINSFIHHHSYSPKSDKSFRKFINLPKGQIKEHSINLSENLVTPSLKGKLAQPKIQGANLLESISKAASSGVRDHSKKNNKQETAANHVSIMNANGEKVFIPEIPFHQIRKIIVIDGKTNLPTVIHDSNEKQQGNKGIHLGAFNPATYFQSQQGLINSNSQELGRKIIARHPRVALSQPSFESRRSPSNLETLKILATVNNGNHVRKSRQQIIENVLKGMKEEETPPSGNN